MKSRLDSINDWNSRARRAKYRVSPLAKHCRINERHLRRYFISKFGFSPRALMSIESLNQARSLAWLRISRPARALAECQLLAPVQGDGTPLRFNLRDAQVLAFQGAAPFLCNIFLQTEERKLERSKAHTWGKQAYDTLDISLYMI
jgi:hypothetical protein